MGNFLICLKSIQLCLFAWNFHVWWVVGTLSNPQLFVIPLNDWFTEKNKKHEMSFILNYTLIVSADNIFLETEKSWARIFIFIIWYFLIYVSWETKNIWKIVKENILLYILHTEQVRTSQVRNQSWHRITQRNKI